MTVLTETYLEMKRRHVDEVNQLIADALRQTNGNKRHAAKLIGMHPTSIWRRISEHGIEYDGEGQ